MLPDRAHHHLTTVLRRHDGTPLVVADGAGCTAAAVLHGRTARLSGPPRAHPPPRPAIEVVHALPKGRKLDEVVRTLAELGIAAVHPVAAERSVARLHGARADRAVQRWTAIARSAAEQSRQPWRPVVSPVRPAGSVWDLLGRGEGRDGAGSGVGTAGVVAHPTAPRRLGEVLTAPERPERFVVAVGPEGGWTGGEVAAAEAAGLWPASLGPAVLRTEHAATVVTAVVAHVLGRLG